MRVSRVISQAGVGPLRKEPPRCRGQMQGRQGYRRGRNFGTMRSTDAERDASCGRDAAYGSEVCLRHDKRNTSHHCECNEQHHYAKNNITCPLGHTSLDKTFEF